MEVVERAQQHAPLPKQRNRLEVERGHVILPAPPTSLDAIAGCPFWILFRVTRQTGCPTGAGRPESTTRTGHWPALAHHPPPLDCYTQPAWQAGSPTGSPTGVGSHRQPTTRAGHWLAPAHPRQSRHTRSTRRT